MDDTQRTYLHWLQVVCGIWGAEVAFTVAQLLDMLKQPIFSLGVWAWLLGTTLALMIVLRLKLK